MMFMTQPQPSGGFEWTQAPWGLALRCVPLEAIAPHVFTIGNLELRSREPEWQALAGAMGVPRDRLRLISQVHSADIAVVRSDGGSWTSPQADGLVTEDGSVAIGVRVADCAPILIADRTRPAVAAVHAGWRGTMKQIAETAIRSLRDELGCDPRDLVAAIGPCLGPCCGEMGPEVVEMFAAAGHTPSTLQRWFTPGPSGKPYFDAWLANRDQLQQAGVPADQIFSSDLCTKSHAPMFHSYRAQGAGTGRMLGMIRAGGGERS
jgi:YfiH family protein